MGASESRPLLSSSDPTAPKQGYHIVRVAENSPAHHANLEPFFDFCIGIDGVSLDVGTTQNRKGSGSGSGSGKNAEGGGGQEQVLGMGAWKKLEEREGTEVTLNVWNSRSQTMRDVPIIPSRLWSSSSTSTPSAPSTPSTQPSLLGLSLRLCDPSRSLQHVWHILDILEGSPASSAGLVPFGDYVIGWSGGTLGIGGEGDFYELVESHRDRSLRLFVYNSDLEITRECVLVPNREWGGEGLLGCGVGYGLLHRIPKSQGRPPALEAIDSSETEDETIPVTPQMGSKPDFDKTPVQRQPPPRVRVTDEDNQINEEHEAEEDDDDDDDEDEADKSGVTVSVREEEDE